MSGREDRDDLAAAIAALRETPVPRRGAHVAAGIFAAFERGSGRRARWRRGIGAIAAAALFVVSLSLAMRAPDASDRLSELAARLTRLEARTAAWARATPRHEAPSPPPGSFAARLAPDFEASGFDPGLLRLVAARRLEGFDDRGAIERYRALLAEYADSPAAAVAKERIELLAP